MSDIATFINSIKGKSEFLSSSYNNKPFVAGTTPVYYSGQFWDEKEVTAAVEALIYGKWLSSGEKVKKFEVEFCKKFSQNHGVMVNSGSSANLVMIAALKKRYGWVDGDEIIVSVVGFPTTISTIVQNGLKPVFVDIEFESLNFDLDKIQEKITNRTKAIFLSPVLGNPPNMNRLQLFGIPIILDGCDSLGTLWENKDLTTYALATSHSFYPAHHISTGEGGMVTSNDLETIKLARSFAWWGRNCWCTGAENLLPNGMCKSRFSNWLSLYDGIVDHKYAFEVMGYNLKPLDLQGSIGSIQLTKFEEIQTKRIYNKIAIDKIIQQNNSLITIKETPGALTCWFGTPVICKDKQTKNSLVTHLEKNKIQTRNYFAGNILLHKGYAHLDNYINYPKANQVLDKVFFLGVSPHYTNEVIKYIHEVFNSWKQ